MTPTLTEDLSALYLAAEQRYFSSLPLDHFMEATDHAKQREITVASFALITAVWPAFQVFNELLIQYPLDDPRRPHQVVPDNFVVVHDQPIVADGSFNVPFQPVGPTLVLEYVSKHNARKDYIENLRRYQDHLKVPYYLLYHPGSHDMILYRLVGRRYQEVKANAAGRLTIPELELEAAVVGDWVRYWFRGKMLALPGELLLQLTAQGDQLNAALEAVAAAERRAAAAEMELAQWKATLSRPTPPEAHN